MQQRPSPNHLWLSLALLGALALSACSPAAPAATLTATRPPTLTPLPPSPTPAHTATAIPPTGTATATPVPPTATFTPVPTFTRTPQPPTATFTSVSTATPSATITQRPPTWTPAPPTPTDTPVATTGQLVVILCQDITVGVLLILTKPDSGEPPISTGLTGAGGAATIIELTPGHWLGTYFASGYQDLRVAYDIEAGKTFTQRIGNCS